MKKVLVVDDDPSVGEVITEYLKDFKEVESEFTPFSQNAVKLLKEKEFDLVITDLIMPEINGIELIEYIYKNHPNVKVLACSGGGDSGALVAGIALDQALTEGADNALMKPFTRDELITKVRDLLKS